MVKSTLNTRNSFSNLKNFSDTSVFFLKFHTNVLTLHAFTFFLTGLLDMLGHDDLDFTAIMGKVLEEAEPKEAGK